MCSFCIGFREQRGEFFWTKKKRKSHFTTKQRQNTRRRKRYLYIFSLCDETRVFVAVFSVSSHSHIRGGWCAKEERRARCVHYVRVGKTPPLFCDGLEREIFGRKARKIKANENTTEDISSSLCDAFAMFLSLSLQQQQQQRERDFCSSEEEEEKDEEDKRRG